MKKVKDRRLYIVLEKVKSFLSQDKFGDKFVSQHNIYHIWTHAIPPIACEHNED